MSEKPAKASKPGLGETVLVTTREVIGGQREHAAIVTRVHDDDLVNVMVLPAIGQPYPVASVYHVRHSKAAALSWRPRSRS
jgi:hypothetical protein